MPAWRICTLVFVCTMVLKYTSAETSLYIPEFHDQPMSVANIGEDSTGRTTWQIVGGSPTGTFTADPEFIGIVCTILNGISTCTESVDGTTTIFIELVTSIIVQGGGTTTVTVAAAPTSTSSSLAVTTVTVTSDNPQTTSSLLLSPKIISSIASSTTAPPQKTSATSTKTMVPTQDNAGSTPSPSAALITANGAKSQRLRGKAVISWIVAAAPLLVILA
ncbi:hypothetical protein EW146_g7032 [Bondarzewia mesenterica]|uniref:Uncharacterized protein n=1 Tax=Bondarzewia mesenterica TaxID=1095465 RepID=A0A4S4LMN5_9AGAM|nr:hypothetical protein EW146_g7032 [Bondarzewia mesenterica]